MRAEETQNGWATRSRASERARVRVCVCVCKGSESAAEDTECLQAHITKRERARQRGAVHRQLRRVTHREEGETRGRRRPVNRGGERERDREKERERDGLKTDYQPSTGKEETALRDCSIRPPVPPPPFHAAAQRSTVSSRACVCACQLQFHTRPLFSVGFALSTPQS